MKIARVLVTSELLREALHFPAGTEIVRAGMPDDPRAWRDIELIIRHDDLRDIALEECVQPPLIRPVFHREADVVMLEDWGQR